MAKKHRKQHTSRMGTLLIEQGLITSRQLDTALAHQRIRGGRVGEILAEQVEGGHSRQEKLEEGVALALASQYGIPRLPLDAYLFEREVTKLLPKHLAKEHCAIPLECIGTSMTVAMADPLNADAVAKLEQATGCTVQVLLGTPSEILDAIETHYGKPSFRPLPFDK